MITIFEKLINTCCHFFVFSALLFGATLFSLSYFIDLNKGFAGDIAKYCHVDNRLVSSLRVCESTRTVSSRENNRLKLR